MIKVLFVRIFEKRQRMEVAVEDKNGRKRMVALEWRTKDETPCPANWLEQVEHELNDQDAEEISKMGGRKLFK